MNSTRPTVLLSEALSLNELERLLLLTSNMEYNHGNVAWGGSWAGHSITCLLQDILEGKTHDKLIKYLVFSNILRLLFVNAIGLLCLSCSYLYIYS